jgi:hypothetical protein
MKKTAGNRNSTGGEKAKSRIQAVRNVVVLVRAMHPAYHTSDTQRKNENDIR